MELFKRNHKEGNIAVAGELFRWILGGEGFEPGHLWQNTGMDWGGHVHHTWLPLQPPRLQARYRVLLLHVHDPRTVQTQLRAAHEICNLLHPVRQPHSVVSLLLGELKHSIPHIVH